MPRPCSGRDGGREEMVEEMSDGAGSVGRERRVVCREVMWGMAVAVAA